MFKKKGDASTVGQVAKAFEMSGKDKDPKGVKEGSKRDTALDKKQMKAMPGYGAKKK